MENFSKVHNNDTVEDDDEVEGPESNVFRNPVLLKLIAENADFDTLKSVRTLNKFCKELLTSQLFNKSRITLQAGTKNQEQLKAIKNLKGINDLKIKARLWNKSFEKEGQMFIEILESLSQTLKSLELDIWTNGEMPLPSASIQFPALSTLKYPCINLGEEKVRRRIKLIYASAPNLTELVDLYQFDFDNDLSLLLAADGSRNWALAPNLKSLTLTKPTFEKDLLHLINFPQTWESLNIRVRLDYKDVFKNIGLLLEKNKDTLVRLKLRLEPDWALNDRQKLKLPTTFPKLEKLELALFQQDYKVSSGGCPINYSKTFPALTSLSLDLSYGDYEELWDDSCDSTPPPPRLWTSLFPPQVFNGLKHLELSDSIIGRLRQVEGIAEDWAQTRFPNATLQIN